jgi:hypothetical protein
MWMAAVLPIGQVVMSPNVGPVNSPVAGVMNNMNNMSSPMNSPYIMPLSASYFSPQTGPHQCVGPYRPGLQQQQQQQAYMPQGGSRQPSTTFNEMIPEMPPAQAPSCDLLAAAAAGKANLRKFANQAGQEKTQAADSLSETSTDGSSELDKFALDGDSMGSSVVSNGGFECFEVSIKNTFVEVSPKASPQKAPIRTSKSVPPHMSPGSHASMAPC